MKKILAVAIIAIMTVVLCVSASATSLVNHSFDTIYVNDTENPVVNNGQAKAWSEENPINEEITALRVRGWAHLDGSTIAAFGYKVDDGEGVFSADYIFDRPDVQAAFQVAADVANGFDVTLDLSNVGAGEHTITILVKGADDEVVEVTNFVVTQKLAGDGSGDVSGAGAEAPKTADAAVIAVAAVAVVALAGIVVAKKVR